MNRLVCDHKHPDALRRLLPRLSVHRLTEEVGMAVVSRVLLDHVANDPSQARSSPVGQRETLLS